MYARHVSHIARHVGARRRLLNLRQADLARHLGVRRQRLIALEKGEPNQNLDLVLRVYEALGLALLMETKNGDAPSWIADAAWEAQRKRTAASRPRLRRSRAYLDKLRAEQTAFDLRANEAARPDEETSPPAL